MSYESIPLVVELYENPDFRGRKVVLIADCPTLTNYDFDDKTSSVKVFRGPTYVTGTKVCLFEHPDYDGGQKDFVEGDAVPELHALGIDNWASSVKFIR